MRECLRVHLICWSVAAPDSLPMFLGRDIAQQRHLPDRYHCTPEWLWCSQPPQSASTTTHSLGPAGQPVLCSRWWCWWQTFHLHFQLRNKRSREAKPRERRGICKMSILPINVISSTSHVTGSSCQCLDSNNRCLNYFTQQKELWCISIEACTFEWQ